MTATDPGWHRPGGSASQTTTHSCSLCVVLGVPMALGQTVSYLFGDAGEAGEDAEDEMDVDEPIAVAVTREQRGPPFCTNQTSQP